MTTITKVTVRRGEGPNVSDFTKHVFEGQNAERDANDYLRVISETAPKEGGYDKTDVVVTLVSGDEIQLRHDVKHYSCEDPDLDVRQHLHDFLYYTAHPEDIPWIKAIPNKHERERKIGNLQRLYAEHKPEFERLLRVLDDEHEIARAAMRDEFRRGTI